LLKTGDSDNIEMVKMISQGQDIDVIELLIDYFKENRPPYFKILNHFNLSKDELNYVFSEIFGEPVTSIVGGFNMAFRIYNKKDYEIYSENSNGYWVKVEYDENGNRIYHENSDGNWEKYEYDDNGNEIYFEDSDHREKREYDEDGNIIYFENSDGNWEKYEYDDNGNEIYFEDSDHREKREYDEDGNIISFEDSITGEKVYYI
jgi:hypothetical protein